MTRDKEIIKAATEARMASAETLTTRGTHLSIDDVPFVNKMITYDEVAENAFIKGAQWADSNPKSPLTDLSQVWHEADEEPKDANWKILCQDTTGCCWVENRFDAQLLHKNWHEYAVIEMLAQWAYISDLLPKGGE